MQYPEYVAKVIDRLESRGFEAYIVGGSVRDTVIGRKPYDFDVTTSALPTETLEAFADFRTIPTGLKHGTVTVISEGKPIEVTTFRIDGEYTDSRHPDFVRFTDSITADLSRRDFTVNAMAYNEKRGLIDPFGGKQDIENRIIRAVGEPHKRFCEDALRIMRAFRFSAQLGFDIEKNTLLAARELSRGLENIARERISAEFLKLICAPEPTPVLELMVEHGALRYVFGEYTPSPHALGALSKTPSSERIRLGILMSDCSEEKAREILSSLRLSGKLTSNTLTIASKAAKPLCRGGCGQLQRRICRFQRADSTFAGREVFFPTPQR